MFDYWIIYSRTLLFFPFIFNNFQLLVDFVPYLINLNTFAILTFCGYNIFITQRYDNIF